MSIGVTSRWSRSLGKWRHLRNDRHLTQWLSLLRSDDQMVEAFVALVCGMLCFKSTRSCWFSKSAQYSLMKHCKKGISYRSSTTYIQCRTVFSNVLYTPSRVVHMTRWYRKEKEVVFWEDSSHFDKGILFKPSEILYFFNFCVCERSPSLESSCLFQLKWYIGMLV